MFVVVQCVLYTLANGSNALLMHNNIIDIDKYKNNWMKLMGEVGMAVQIRALARAYTPCILRMKLHDVVYCCGLQIVIVYNSMTLTNYCTVKKRCYTTPTSLNMGAFSYTRVLQNTPWVFMDVWKTPIGVSIHHYVLTGCQQILYHCRYNLKKS